MFYDLGISHGLQHETNTESILSVSPLTSPGVTWAALRNVQVRWAAVSAVRAEKTRSQRGLRWT